MLRIKPFQGLRPQPGRVEEVACVPYDVVNSAEAAALADGLPNSLLHVDRAEIDFPEGQDPYAPEVYEKARDSFERLQREGILERETEPSLYIYRQQMGRHTQTGVVAVSHVDDYENDVIKKHEKTRRVKEDDRTRLISTLGANTGPVFLTYRDEKSIDARVEQAAQQQPLYDFTAPDGVQHTLWKAPAPQELVDGFKNVPAAYVADGHHRSASAARVGRERREANPQHTGEEDYNWFLTVLFPASQLQILAYNRVVHDLNGLSAEEFLQRATEKFRCEPAEQPEPQQQGQAAMYLKGQWHLLYLDPPADADPVSKLDVSILQNELLAPVLGIDDPRISDRIDFVGGIRGAGELQRRVDSGESEAAFSLYPTTVGQLMDIADARQIMPPKSTWFEPKLRSGLVIHTF